MCGLIGYITSLTNGFAFKEVDAFKGAMFLNQFRGGHATGVVAVDNKLDTYTWLKSVGGPHKFFDGKDGSDLEKFILNRAVLAFGHGRHATRGSADKLECAHPFEVEIPGQKNQNLVFMHNGTLHMHQPMLREDPIHKFEVDSHWLATQIAKFGPEEALAKTKGAMACLWWNSHTQRFYVYRNTERPLYYILSKDKTELMLNSEEASIAWCKFRYKLTDFDLNDMLEVPAFMLYEVNPLDLKDFKATKIEPEKEKWSGYQGGGHQYPGWMRDMYSEGGENFTPYSFHQSNYARPGGILTDQRGQPFYFSDINDLDTLAKSFALGRVTRVRFFEKVIQYYKDENMVCSVPKKGFLENVKEITRDRDFLILQYNEANKREKLHYACLKEEDKEEPKAPVTPITESNTKKWKFPLTANVFAIYKAKRNKDGRIEELNSSVEGIFKIGTELEFEPYGLRNISMAPNPTKNDYLKVDCVLWNRKNTKLLRFSFYGNEWDEEQVYKHLFKGKIDNIIKLQRTDPDGCEFEIILKDVKISESTKILEAEVIPGVH
jgi:hypothetical protein